jgi:hypothetical protein
LPRRSGRLPHGSLPADNNFRASLDALRTEAEATTGRPPTVIALATRVGLTNTTFRNFPSIVTQIAHAPEGDWMPDTSQSKGSASMCTPPGAC